ncbi:MAG: hypothetical protein HY694_05845 [Deltaproteobacteria bacterium]|nr:hypothetical protein [Deltaproteobacteria bacterium]
MSHMISLGVGNSVMNMVRVCALWLFAACFGLLVPLSSVWGAFPCEDVNNDGVCELGVDNDITVELKTNGYFSTPESIAIPKGVKGLSTKDVNDFSLVAGKNIVVNSNLNFSAEGATLSLLAQQGSITIGNKTNLKTGQGGYIDLSARSDIVLSTGSYVGGKSSMVTIYSEDGSVLLTKGSRLSSLDAVDIIAFGGGITVPKSQLRAQNGYVSIYAVGDVTVTGSLVQANGTNVQAGGNLLDFRKNSVKVLGDGWVSLSVSGSTLDLCGTHFKNLDSANLIIDAETVNCMP